MQVDATLTDAASLDDIRYTTDVTDFFLALRGTGTCLSPNDMALIQAWHDAGVPLNTVLRGLQRGSSVNLKRARPVRSLAALNKAVEKEARGTAPRRERGQKRRTFGPRTLEAGLPVRSEDVGPSPEALETLLEGHRSSLDAFAQRSAGLPSIQTVFWETRDALEPALRGPRHALVGILGLGRTFYERLWLALPDVDRDAVDAEIALLLHGAEQTLASGAETDSVSDSETDSVTVLDPERMWELRLRALRDRFGLFDPQSWMQVWDAHG